MPRPLQMALLLALVLRASLAAAFALPPWAKPLPGGRPIRVAYARRNKRTVAAENAAYQRPDVAIYGDSITAGIRVRQPARAVWDAYFGGYKTVVLGLGGSTVEELTYRLLSGHERLVRSPRVIILLIGINNHPARQPELQSHMAFLLSWLAATYSRSRIILLAPLPSVRPWYLRLDAMWADVAARQVAAYKAAGRPAHLVFARCGALLDPRNPAFFHDGVHPAAGGYRRIFSCLAPIVNRAIQASKEDDAVEGITT